MGFCMRRLWLGTFAIFLGAQVCAAANLKSGERAYNRAEQARKKEDKAAAAKGYAAAFKEFSPLANKGDPEAEYYLGKMYLLGQGVAKDEAEAIKWFKASGDQGNPDAQFFLGSIYLLPRKDIKAGLMWMRLSAEQGNKDAQLLLGQTYMQGLKELPRDSVQADMWLRLAADNNLPFYKAQLVAAEQRMNAFEIAKGKALAAAWKPKHGLRPGQEAITGARPEKGSATSNRRSPG